MEQKGDSQSLLVFKTRLWLIISKITNTKVGWAHTNTTSVKKKRFST